MTSAFLRAALTPLSISFSKVKATVGLSSDPVSLKAPGAILSVLTNQPDPYGNKRNLQKKVDDVIKASVGLIPAGSQAKKTIEGIK